MSNSPTPPHRPTYNVRLLQPQLSAIIATVLSGYQLSNYTELERGKSFNNRIYFVTVTATATSTTPQLPTKQLVLRLAGHHFNHLKIHNEVGWLLRFKEYCPSVPVPEVIAWSSDGASIETIDRGFLDLAGFEEAKCGHGWVLQTRTPGRMLTVKDLDGNWGGAVLRELAGHMATWRSSRVAWAIRGQAVIGNQRLVDGKPGEESWRPANARFPPNRGFQTGGLLLTNKQETPSAGLRTWTGYYQFLLNDQYNHMTTAPELAHLRQRIADKVTAFLPQLPLLPFLSTADNAMRFTHMDFAPRNILISDPTDANKAPKVTGILDFEFSVCLPAPAEFLNSLVNQADDWTPRHYETLLAYLRKLEESAKEGGTRIWIPLTDPPEMPCLDGDRCTCEYHSFEGLKVLEGVIANVAPWYIMSNSHVGREEDLKRDCERAAEVVLYGIEKLRRMLPAGAGP